MTVTEIYAVADPLYMRSSPKALGKLVRAVSAPVIEDKKAA